MTMYAPRFELIDNNIAVMRNRVRVKNGDDSDYSDDDAGKQRGLKGHKSKSSRFALRGNSALMIALMLFLCMGIIYQGRETFRRRSTISAAARSGNAARSSDAKPIASEMENSTPNESEPKVAEDVSAPKEEAETDASDTGKSTLMLAPKALTKDWEHCIKSPPQPKEKVVADKRVEPMWFPAYPTALPAIYSEFIVALTGVDKGAKSFYRSSPSLKRCHSTKSKPNVDAITCDIVHPIIPCNRPSPAAQAGNFREKVLLSLRNPLSAFFAYYQMKQENYHGQKGQVSREEWIAFRDEWVGDGSSESRVFNEWKGFIMEWRNMKPYHVGEYIPYEYWLDESKGPPLVARLSRIFKQEGYPVLYDEDGDSGRKDLDCLWHKHIYEPLVAIENQHLEEGWYVAEYTEDQLIMLSIELEKFAAEIRTSMISKDESNGERPGDAHLTAILKGYAATVRSRIQ